MDFIHRSEIIQELGTRWIADIRLDGKEAYRELPQFGNRHVVFEGSSDFGHVHWDQYNAISQPISHLSKWGNEKTGINEGFLRLFGYGLALYGGYKLAKYLDEDS